MSPKSSSGSSKSTGTKAASYLALLQLFGGMVSAHMIMANPIPMGLDTLNNSPLDASGSDYPCKQRAGVYANPTVNEWQPGSKQTLSFKGTAVHGGGSCQLALTKDKAPTASSSFKVIYSIEGGCPGKDGAPSTFDFTVPAEVPAGEYTMAWTWFNHIGNREMYMNCAAVKVSGGSGSDSAFNGLPDMALANIASKTQCKTQESFDYIFENPGKYVSKQGNGPFAPLCGGASGGTPGGAPQAPAPGAPQQSPAAANPGIPSPAPAPSVNPGIPSPASQAPQAPQAPPAQPLMPGMPNQPPALPSTLQSVPSASKAPYGNTTGAPHPTAPLRPTGSAPASAPAPAPAAPSAPAAAPSAPAPAPGNTPQGPTTGNPSCAQEGQMLCNGPAQFGLCNHGTVVWQPVAPGTQCREGRIMRRSRAWVVKY